MREQRLGAKEKPEDAIDWQQLRRRLDLALAAVEQGSVVTFEEKKRLLHARAKVLARQPEVERTEGEGIDVVEFLLAHERYCIEATFVREVYTLRDLTPLPLMPPFVLGVVNLRGQILSVIDIRKFFELSEKSLTDLNKIIVVRGAQMELGILADSVLGVRSIVTGEIQPSLPTLTGMRADYLKGVTPERMVVLDAEKLLSDEKILLREERQAGRQQDVL